MNINHIVIQAGGRGTRLQHFTRNKPKALISVRGVPIIINTMRLYPKAHFVIIGDYQYDVLKKYLKQFAHYRYTLIKTNGEKTSAGISDALRSVPSKTPFMLLWCDLFFEKEILPKNMDFKKDNYIGLSRDFPCRWSFDGKIPEEKKSDKNGIAGVFVFKDKSEIENVPLSGEFCKYLAEVGISFKKFYLSGAIEVGLYDIYKKMIKAHLNVRPFNSILFKGRWAIKKPINEQGRKLSIDEGAWYRFIKGKKLDFVPKVKAYRPIILQKINGGPVFGASISERDKQTVLGQMIDNLKKIHALGRKESFGAYENNKNAILSKTKARLDSVKSLIPHIHDDFILINHKKCINFYKFWGKVEKICQPQLLGNNYVFIHGDPTFSNTLYDANEKKTYLIDPRGYYGAVKLFGDEDYDWAKLYYSMVGDYDQFNSKNFSLTFSGEEIKMNILSSGWNNLEGFFFKQIGRDENKIKIFHAIIWLSLTSYAWDDYDSICGAFYKGIYLMQECYERAL